MWRRRRNRAKNPNCVGTEAAAVSNMEKNGKDFGYPDDGFVTPVEHSLLYAMLSTPDIYPVDVMKETISKEDFNEYLTVAQKLRTNDELEDHPVTSYAQLSALLGLASAKWPPPSESRETESSGSKPDSNNIPQILCKALIQCVVRHAEEYDLDREEEVQELFDPIRRLALREGDKKVFTLVLPAYIGLGASMLTANPLPLMVGTSVTNALSVSTIMKDHPRQMNLQQLSSTTNRMADAEKAGLLEESEQI